MPVKPNHLSSLKDRDLAAEWAGAEDKRFKPKPSPEERAVEKLAEGMPQSWKKKRVVPPGSRTGMGGVAKGSQQKATVAIKSFMLSILDNPTWRASMEKRILAGELPQVELFLLTKTLGKPTEEINITANVPLFSLPTAFVMREDQDVIEADAVPAQLGPGDTDGTD